MGKTEKNQPDLRERNSQQGILLSSMVLSLSPLALKGEPPGMTYLSNQDSDQLVNQWDPGHLCYRMMHEDDGYKELC